MLYKTAPVQRLFLFVVVEIAGRGLKCSQGACDDRFSIYCCCCLCRAGPNVCGFVQMTRCNFHMYNICIARVGDSLIYGLLDVTCERLTFYDILVLLVAVV